MARAIPSHLRGEAIGLPARLVQLAAPVEVYSRRRGVDAALAIARRHRGTQFDPAIVDVFCDHAPELLDGLDQASEWDAVLDAEPELSRRVGGADLDEVLEAMADLVDLKSPYLAGHSRGVANLVGEAARVCRVPGDDVRGPAARGAHPRPRPARRLQRDLGQGRAAHRGRIRARPAAPVPDRPHAGPGDRARQKPRDRLTSPRASGRLRLPTGLTAVSLTPSDRLLAAADVYHAMTEPRPVPGRG